MRNLSVLSKQVIEKYTQVEVDASVGYLVVDHQYVEIVVEARCPEARSQLVFFNKIGLNWLY